MSHYDNSLSFSGPNSALLLNKYKVILSNRRSNYKSNAQADAEKQSSQHSKARLHKITNNTSFNNRLPIKPNTRESIEQTARIQQLTSQQDRTFNKLLISPRTANNSSVTHRINRSNPAEFEEINKNDDYEFEVEQHKRYFEPRLRRILYGPNSNHWSASIKGMPINDTLQDKSKIKIGRKIQPVDELIKRIEAATEAEQVVADKKYKTQYNRTRRLSLDSTTGSDCGFGSTRSNNQLVSTINSSLDLMSLLDSSTLHNIKREFDFADKSLELEEFVEVMKANLSPSIQQEIGEVRLAAYLCEFFSSVDINGDNKMNWNEFTNYIADAGMNKYSSGQNGDSGNSAANKQPDHSSYAANGLQIDPYQPSALHDKNKYDAAIEKLFYFDNLDHLLLVEKGSSKFSVFGGKKLSKICSVHTNSPQLLACEYLDSYNYVATTATDRIIQFWDPWDYYRKLPVSIICRDTVLAMRYNSGFNALFTADENKVIHTYKFGPEIEKAALNSANNNNKNYSAQLTGNPMTGHSDLVLDLLALSSQSCLASASLDKTVALWDITTQTLHSTLKGHKRGVFQLSYNNEFHCLVSAACEHSAIVWNSYCGKKICKLQGHFSPLIGVYCVPNSPQIITADSGGIVKVFDARTWTAVQTLYVEEAEQRLLDAKQLIVMPKHKRFLCNSNKRLHFFDSLTATSYLAPNIADLEAVSALCYNSQFDTVITAANEAVKIWSAASGCLERAYREVTTAEITDIMLDDSQKKFITADAAGFVTVFNYLNAVKLKSIQLGSAGSPRSMVTSISYVPGLKHIFAVSWSSVLHILDESLDGGEELKLKKQVQFQKQEMLIACSSLNLTLLAIGTSSNTVILWDYRSNVQIHEFNVNQSKSQEQRQNSKPNSGAAASKDPIKVDRSILRNEISALCFLDPYPLLAVADSDHSIYLYVLRPILLNIGKCILRFSHDAAVTQLAFKNGLLFAGDAKGAISVFDLSSAIIRKWGFKPFESADILPSPSNPMTEAQQQQQQQSNSSSRYRASRAADYIDYRKAHKGLIEKLEWAARKNEFILSSADIELVHYFQAHTDAIRQLKIIPTAHIEHYQPYVFASSEIDANEGYSKPDAAQVILLSSSFDRRVCVYRGDGEQLGALQQGRTTANSHAQADHLSPAAWNFQTNHKNERTLQAERNARKVLNQLRKQEVQQQYRARRASIPNALQPLPAEKYNNVAETTAHKSFVPLLNFSALKNNNLSSIHSSSTCTARSFYPKSRVNDENVSVFSTFRSIVDYYSSATHAAHLALPKSISVTSTAQPTQSATVTSAPNSSQFFLTQLQHN
jgi:WD40 repeat protein